MIKFFEKIRLGIKKINKKLDEFSNYDRLYWDGKLTSCMIVILSLLIIGCISLLLFVLE